MNKQHFNLGSGLDPCLNLKRVNIHQTENESFSKFLSVNTSCFPECVYGTVQECVRRLV